MGGLKIVTGAQKRDPEADVNRWPFSVLFTDYSLSHFPVSSFPRIEIRTFSLVSFRYALRLSSSFCIKQVPTVGAFKAACIN